MAIFTVEDGRVVEQEDFPIESRAQHDRVRLLKAKEIDTVICGGVQALYEDMLKGSGIRVISWVSGKVEDLLRQFLDGRLVPGTARLGDAPGADLANLERRG